MTSVPPGQRRRRDNSHFAPGSFIVAVRCHQHRSHNQRYTEHHADDGLESQLASFNQAMLEDDEIQELVAETIAFAASLDSTLHHGSLDQRRTALRRCVDTMVVEHQDKRAEITLRVLPMGLDSQATAWTKTIIVKLTKKSSPNALQDEPSE